MSRPRKVVTDMIIEPNAVTDVRQLYDEAAQEREHYRFQLEELQARYDLLEQDYQHAINTNESMALKVQQLSDQIACLDATAGEKIKVDGDYLWCIIPKDRGHLVATIGNAGGSQSQVEVIINGERTVYPCDKYVAVHKDHARVLGIDVE